MNVFELQPRFAALFDGLKVAHGTGKGQWIKRPLRPEDWIKHLNGEGPGIGVAPLREDSTVAFAAIDLDEPDFEAAREMQRYIPGASFIERSRSGNAHVWVFFNKACPAWLAMGVLKEAYLAAGKKVVEVFPKNHDFERVQFGNYINLPYHGDDRPILGDPEDVRDYDDPVIGWDAEASKVEQKDYLSGFFDLMPRIGDVEPHTLGRVRVSKYESMRRLSLAEFLDAAESSLNDPDDWMRRASLMQIDPPSARKSSAQFGSQKNLHSCAEHIISGNIGHIPHGHQNATLFMLAKCLTNWEQVDHDEAMDILLSVSADLFDPVPSRREVLRILTNVERARYTSTGCDDPLVQPFTDPNCPIANPRR